MKTKKEKVKQRKAACLEAAKGIAKYRNYGACVALNDGGNWVGMTYAQKVRLMNQYTCYFVPTREEALASGYTNGVTLFWGWQWSHVDNPMHKRRKEIKECRMLAVLFFMQMQGDL